MKPEVAVIHFVKKCISCSNIFVVNVHFLLFTGMPLLFSYGHRLKILNLKFSNDHFITMVREYKSSTGITIKVGQTDKENDVLIKTSHQDHLWCHLDNMPSPHAIIESSEPDAQTIHEASQLIKYFSKAKTNPQVGVITNKVRNVGRVDPQKPGLVQMRRKPTRRSIRTDGSILLHFGLSL